MPLKDERLYFKIRIPRVYRARLGKVSKMLKKNKMDVVSDAVDNWLQIMEYKGK